MKILANKLIRIIFPLIVVIGTSILSNLYSFNFMNYSFMPSRLMFIIISLLMLLGLSRIRSKVKIISLDDQYLYQLHYLLIIIWIFLFFFYKIFFISFITMLFNFVILILLVKCIGKLYKKYIFLILYLLWFIYLIIINFLILL